MHPAERRPYNLAALWGEKEVKFTTQAQPAAQATAKTKKKAKAKAKAPARGKAARRRGRKSPACMGEKRAGRVRPPHAQGIRN